MFLQASIAFASILVNYLCGFILHVVFFPEVGNKHKLLFL
jgi:hypothetical protein